MRQIVTGEVGTGTDYEKRKEKSRFEKELNKELKNKNEKKEEKNTQICKIEEEEE